MTKPILWDKYWKQFNIPAPPQDKEPIPRYVQFFSHAIPILIGSIILLILLIFVVALIIGLFVGVLGAL